MSAVGLTPKMQRVKEFISVYSAMHGVCPTFKEISDNIGIKSKSGIHRLVVALVKRGHATQHSKHYPRNIRIIENICPTCGHGSG